MGKTSVVLEVVPRPFLFFCTDISNPTVKKMDWVPNTPDGIAYIKEHPLETLAVRCYHKGTDILSLCLDHRRAYVLDEISNLFSPGRPMKGLCEYAKEVRYKDEGLIVFATSQRPACDVWPAIYFAAHCIKWVGPLYEDKDIKTLFGHRSSNMAYEEFAAKVRNLKPYDWRRKNFQDSVVVVKNLKTQVKGRV